jgi:hypothetical protein
MRLLRRCAPRNRSTLAAVAELVDAHDSKSCEETRIGSIPISGTTKF